MGQSTIPEGADEGIFETPTGFRIRWAGYAQYEFDASTAGPLVRVARETDIDQAEAARGFLFSVLPIALPFLGLEPLHGSAVGALGKRLSWCLATRGVESRALASAMVELGCSILSDDACAIDDRLQLWPGPPLVNPRWKEVALSDVASYNGKAVKAAPSSSRVPHSIAIIVRACPTPGADLQMCPLEPRRRLETLLENVRMPDLFTRLRQHRQFRVAAGLAERKCFDLIFDPMTHGPRLVAQVLTRVGTGSEPVVR